MTKVAKETTDTDKKPTKRKTAAEIRQAQRTKQQQQRTGFDQTRDNAHEYLKQWATDFENWKFNSAKQRWIVQHLYMDAHMPAEIFNIAIDYLKRCKGETLRTSMIDDARLIVDPMLANNSNDIQKTRRARALGLLPSHVTKAESKATKKAAKTAKANLADPAADAKAGGDEVPNDDEGSSNDADQEQNTAGVSETACQRAARVIEALSEQPKQTNDKSGSKRKRTDDDDKDTMLKNKEHRKKAKEEEVKKRREARAMKKEEKEKIKAEKMAKKERKKARKIEKEKKKAEKAQKKRAKRQLE
ncbi:hypothetical protein GGI23_001482 [Coemansia sp. RSA 2559]|nr:hypothetical protein GGI23_001482 [Coemansia sp. RSA 2559]KAJ2865144.1 hypothetical protein GGI22_001566 [Coemansia erecta]